jgi:hypothetical protein
MTLRPDIECLDEIWGKHRADYSGKWISTAWQFYGNALYQEAADAFGKARDGFGKKSLGWQCLEAWRAHAEHKSKAKPKKAQ